MNENKGKNICSTLKAIRTEIAKANDIEYTPIECNHVENCSGTCPACEAELKMITDKLQDKEENGEDIVIDGIVSTLPSVNSDEDISNDASSEDIGRYPDILEGDVEVDNSPFLEGDQHPFDEVTEGLFSFEDSTYRDD